MFCKVDSLYIIVDDMERAISFYEDFFEQKVSEKGEVGSCFEVDGFRFNLFAYKMVNETHVYGSNCLPSLHFDTLEKMKEKLEGKEICFPLMKIGKNWVAEFVDSEGNHIEVYTAITE
jgi:predicted enzyme related to lactoylglutathione lyase